MSDDRLNKQQSYNIRLLASWFLYTTLSGGVRKWVLSDSLTGNLMLGLQIAAPLLFVMLAKTKPLAPFITTLMTGFSLLLLLMTVNPLAKTVLHGTIGYFLHTGVFFPLLVYLNDREAFPLERLNRLFVLVILAEVALGVVQFVAPPASFINRYVRDMAEYGGIAIVHATNRVRVTGTFSYLGGMTSLFTLIGFWVWGLRVNRGRTLYMALIIGSAVIISPMTGARSLSALLAILIGAGFIATPTNVRNSLAMAALFGITLVVVRYSDMSLLNEAYSGLQSRVVGHSTDGENASRSFGQIAEIINFSGAYPLFGTGLGGTYQGAISLFGQSDAVRAYGYYEEEPERIILEGGYLLFFARLLVWILVLRLSRIPLAFGLLLLIIHLFYVVTVFNVFTAFYELLGLMYLDRSYYLREQRAEKVTSAVSLV